MSAEIEKRITACVKKFVDGGGEIIEGSWNVKIPLGANRYEAESANPGEDGPYEVCPLGALLLAQDPRDWADEVNKDAASVLGVHPDWCWSFTSGFDGGEAGGDSYHYFFKDAYDMGRAFRKMYVSG